jgi:hypothetical protein
MDPIGICGKGSAGAATESATLSDTKLIFKSSTATVETL